MALTGTQTGPDIAATLTAVEAALWVVGKPPGLYDMMDVLGFK